MRPSEKMRKRIYEIIQIGNMEDLPSRLFDYFIVGAIIANIAVLLLDTFDELNAYDTLFHAVEIITVLIFCAEYGLRIWTADLMYPEQSRGRAVLRFLFSFEGIIEFLTILSFFFLTGMGALRFLRVARIFHLFRINSQFESFQAISSVLKEKLNAILYSVFIILVLILASSVSMYGVEHSAQPEAFRNALSGIWWSVSTVFTVGYGDIYPITGLGRVLGVIITFLGVGAVAIPTGILSAGFVEHYSRMQRSLDAAKYKNSAAVILIDESSPYICRTVKEAEEMNGMCVTALIRGEMVVIPADPIKIQEGDVLLVQKL